MDEAAAGVPPVLRGLAAAIIGRDLMGAHQSVFHHNRADRATLAVIRVLCLAWHLNHRCWLPCSETRH